MKSLWYWLMISHPEFMLLGKLDVLGDEGEEAASEAEVVFIIVAAFAIAAVVLGLFYYWVYLR